MTVLPDVFEERNKLVCFAEFLKLGVALILRYLVTDLLLAQTKLVLVRPGPYYYQTRKLPSIHSSRGYCDHNCDNCRDVYF